MDTEQEDFDDFDDYDFGNEQLLIVVADPANNEEHAAELVNDGDNMDEGALDLFFI